MRIHGALIAAAMTLIACPVAAQDAAPDAIVAEVPASLEADRQAILAMAGNFAVTFDFTETVALAPGYELKEPKLSGAHEVVRVIEDRGTFISLQHILVVGGPDEKFPVKHWRQDWQYEPARALMFVGGNAWAWRDIPEAERPGTWSQTVYQVDDTPRYAATGPWTHDDGISEWTPAAEWRPLPRRDMTTRDDYHAVDAVNRHTITPTGWVHEQDNTKLILGAEPKALVREVGVNTYQRSDDFDVAVATDYWAATDDYWTAVRAEWTRLAEETETFAITIKGETQALYMPLLGYADSYAAGEIDLEEAVTSAQKTIGEFVTNTPDPLTARLREPAVVSASAGPDAASR
ncbi:MAG: DUF6607 family protein [Pseudomonadota bacterium]